MARQARQAAQFVRVDEDEEEESFVATRQVEMTSAGAMPVATGDTHEWVGRTATRSVIHMHAYTTRAYKLQRFP